MPLNNQLQTVDTTTADLTALAAARERFEARWNYWNTIRTAAAIFSTTLLLIALVLGRGSLHELADDRQHGDGYLEQHHP